MLVCRDGRSSRKIRRGVAVTAPSASGKGVTVQTGPNGAASVNAGGVKVQTGPGGGTKVVVPGMGTVTTP